MPMTLTKKRGGYQIQPTGAAPAPKPNPPAQKQKDAMRKSMGY